MGRGRNSPPYEGPQRTCLGCRTRRAQADLCRLVVAPAGLVWDERRALPGRGAYVCRAEACALKSTRHLAHALRMPQLVVDSGAVWRALTHVPDPVYDPDLAPPESGGT